MRDADVPSLCQLTNPSRSARAPVARGGPGLEPWTRMAEQQRERRRTWSSEVYGRLEEYRRDWTAGHVEGERPPTPLEPAGDEADHNRQPPDSTRRQE